MKISIDTKEDSNDEIRKVISMLQNILGDSQQIFSNQPVSSDSNSNSPSPFANIFGDAADLPSEATQESEISSTPQISKEETAEETSQSTDDLFAELFSEEELNKMEPVKEPEDEEEEQETKPKSKRPEIEFY